MAAERDLNRLLRGMRPALNPGRFVSALDAVGLTAAVAGELAGAGLSCNVVAGYHHDHLFVPYDRAAEAVALLDALARRAAAEGTPPG